MDQYIKSNYYWIEIITKFIFYFSFGIGTLLFGLYVITKNEKIVVFGLFYVFSALLVNVLFTIYLLILILGTSKYHKEIIKFIGLLALNIPIAFFYFCMVLKIIK